MSLPSTGDDGCPAARWEDTAMRQEFDTVMASFEAWKVKFHKEVPSPEFQAVVDISFSALIQLGLIMEGDI